MAGHREEQQCYTLEGIPPGKAWLCIVWYRSTGCGRSSRPPSGRLPRSNLSWQNRTGRVPVAEELGPER
eukprot:3113439-Rhodomonas_salina.1